LIDEPTWRASVLEVVAERGDQEIESPVHLEFSTGEPPVTAVG
jgi:hypothetical protein